ncbi:hypothetical protein [Pseudomonas fulva]|uniref:hypothetical protein n=1 Tax=Pseudomonas fulva TaxID=47880 RepID=UPI00191EB8C4|nr:hypothetical protein [Pseudomonas fulva]MBN4166875.1 hypothetical protein [Pseudomonas fulva]
MQVRNNKFKDRIELHPNDWLFWSDEDFNDWRRKHDFPRIVDFLFFSLPYFSLWLSEQIGLTEEDLLFHGPARFIRSYDEEVFYIEHDAGFTLPREIPGREVVRYQFISSSKIRSRNKLKILRQVRFVSYMDWALARSEWAFPNKTKDVRELAFFLTPMGRSHSSDPLNSHSNIQFNIPLFMRSLSLDSLTSHRLVGAPPMLNLLKLGGGEIEIADGLVGEKNLEFTNIDNLILTSPIITSSQSIAFSTLRNFKITGSITIVNFYQCEIEMTVNNGGLYSCHFDHGNLKIELNNSRLNRSSINSSCLNLKLSGTEVTDCRFNYSELLTPSSKNERDFHKSAKMIYSHLGYPDLAGEHFLLERKSERKNRWEVFSDRKSGVGVKARLLALLGFLWMSLQELYWGYGERPLYVITFSISLILIVSSLAYFGEYSSTHNDALTSITYSFQSFTNISITKIDQASKILNLIGAVMSFFGLMSVGLLIASLSSKTKNYN